MKWEIRRYSKSMFCSVEKVVYIAASMVGEEGSQYHLANCGRDALFKTIMLI